MSLPSEGRLSRAILVACLLFLAVALIPAAAAQEATPKAEIFAGYSWLHPGANVGGVDVPNINKGWGSAVTYNFNRHLGLTADFGGHYADFGNVHTIMFGPQVKLPLEGITPFAEALFGLNRVSPSGFPSSNAFGLAVGGGFDLHVVRHLNIRLVQVDYVHSKHDFAGTDVSFNGARVQTGLVFLLGAGAPGPPPSASCSVDPAEVYAGEPVRATASAHNFNPKRTLSYTWSATGGKISGKDSTANVDTADLNPGSYNVSAHVSDGKKAAADCSASFTIKERPKHPPQISCSASPATVQSGTPSTITCTCTTPDSGPEYKPAVTVSIGNWSSTGGKVSGSGNTATLDTAGAPAGPITVSATCTDSRGLSNSASATVNVEVPPPPPQASKLSECEFPNKAKPGRVDNTCKAVLDDVALRLQRDADAKGVVVGFADAKEKGGAKLAAERASNTKTYLSKEKGIDPSRIEVRTGSGGGKKTEMWIVPAGATFSEAGTTVVSEKAAPAPKPKKAAPKKAAPAAEKPAAAPKAKKEPAKKP